MPEFPFALFCPPSFPQDAGALDQSPEQGLLVERRVQTANGASALRHAFPVRRRYIRFHVYRGFAFAASEPVRSCSASGGLFLVAIGNEHGLCGLLGRKNHAGFSGPTREACLIPKSGKLAICGWAPDRITWPMEKGFDHDRSIVSTDF